MPIDFSISSHLVRLPRVAFNEMVINLRANNCQLWVRNEDYFRAENGNRVEFGFSLPASQDKIICEFGTRYLVT